MDGQAQLDVSGEDANNSREARGKILDLAIFSSQEALSLHSPGKSGSLAILNVGLMRAHLRTYSAGFYYSNSV